MSCVAGSWQFLSSDGTTVCALHWYICHLSPHMFSDSPCPCPVHVHVMIFVSMDKSTMRQLGHHPSVFVWG